VTVREADAGTQERKADERDDQADVRERENMEREVRADREGQ